MEAVLFTQAIHAAAHSAMAALPFTVYPASFVHAAARMALSAGAGFGGRPRPAAAATDVQTSVVEAIPDDAADLSSLADLSSSMLLALHGALLRRLRKQAGMSQAELAARLSYTQQEVSHWERGVHRVPVALRGQILTLLLDVRQTRHNNLQQLSALIELGRLQREMEQWPSISEWE